MPRSLGSVASVFLPNIAGAPSRRARLVRAAIPAKEQRARPGTAQTLTRAMTSPYSVSPTGWKPTRWKNASGPPTPGS